MSDKRLILEILAQIRDATGRIERRFSSINSPDVFLQTKKALISWTVFA